MPHLCIHCRVDEPMPGVGRSADKDEVDDSIPTEEAQPLLPTGAGSVLVVDGDDTISAGSLAGDKGGAGLDVGQAGAEAAPDMAEEKTTDDSVPPGPSPDTDDLSGSEGAFDAALEGLSVDASSVVDPFVLVNGKPVRWW